MQKMNHLIILVIIGVVMLLTPFLHLDAEQPINDATMMLGFIIVAAFFSGQLTNSLNLPKITGYMIIGVLCGPWVLKLVTYEHLTQLKLIDKLALALISFTAGAELKFGHIRSQFRSISLIIMMQCVTTFVLLTTVVYVSRGLIAGLENQPLPVILSFCCIIGTIGIAKSPWETIAIIIETRARGKLTDTVLGITILKDIVVIILFTLVLNLVKPIVDPTLHFSLISLGYLFGEMLLSIGVGAVFGWIVIIYLRYIRHETLIFILSLVFFIVVVCDQFHLELLLTCIATGFVVQAFSPFGHTFLESVERGSLPVYLVFFSLAGAKVNLPTFYHLWPLALIIVPSRILAVFLGTYWGATLAGDEPKIKRYAWAGFIGQAGVTLGLAILAENQLPIIGGIIKDIVVACIVINLMIGPILFKWALHKSGEINSAAGLPHSPADKQA